MSCPHSDVLYNPIESNDYCYILNVFVFVEAKTNKSNYLLETPIVYGDTYNMYVIKRHRSQYVCRIISRKGPPF